MPSSPYSKSHFTSRSNKTIAVIGAGSWGTALSLTLANLDHAVKLWAYEKEVAESILKHRENELFLPGIKLPINVSPTNDLAEALEGAEFVLTVMPSHVCRSLYNHMLPYLRPEMTTQVQIIVAVKDNVLDIPNNALKWVDGRQVVFVQDSDGKIRQVTPELGLAGVTHTEVLEGLAAGDKVATQVVLPGNKEKKGKP